MDRSKLPSLDPSSPWYRLSELRKPNVKWCEAQNNTWIVEPANTWSNLAYLLVGYFLFGFVKKSKVKSSILKFYPWMAIIAGTCSFIYHSSYTFVLQILDFIGMYVIFYPVLFINLIRLGKMRKEKFFIRLTTAVTLTTLFTIAADFTNFPIQAIVFGILVLIVISEFVLAMKPSSTHSMKNFHLASLSITIAAIFSILDVTRIWCVPENTVLHGHAIWHCFSALSTFFMFQHQKQFDNIL